MSLLSSERNIETLSELVAEVRAFVASRGEYYKLTLVEKTVRVLTAIVTFFFILLLGLLVVIFASIALALALSKSVGLIAACAIIAGIYLLLLLLCVIFRKCWIEGPIVRFFAKLMLE